MAVTGSCPGTSLVQMGAGIANGFLVTAGGILGAAAFIKLQPRLKAARAPHLELQPPIEAGAGTESKPLDIATALGVHPITMLLIWVPMCLAIMLTAYAKDSTTHSTPFSGLVPPAYGGLLIGIAQLGTTLLTVSELMDLGQFDQVVSTWSFAQSKLPRL